MTKHLVILIPAVIIHQIRPQLIPVASHNHQQCFTWIFLNYLVLNLSPGDNKIFLNKLHLKRAMQQIANHLGIVSSLDREFQIILEM